MLLFQDYFLNENTITRTDISTFEMYLYSSMILIFAVGWRRYQSIKLSSITCNMWIIPKTEDGPIKFRSKRLILGVLLNPLHPTLADISINPLQFHHTQDYQQDSYFLLLLRHFEQFWAIFRIMWGKLQGWA